jgi:opacity protein-like surface antigen
MMKKLALLTIGALALTSSVAMGADMAVKYTPRAAVPPCNCDTWSGFYIGAYFGHGAGKAKESFTNTSTSSNSIIDLAGPPFNDSFFSSTTTSGGSSSGNITGSVVNLVVGGNWQATPFWVLGAQLEGTVFSDITVKTIGTQTSRGTSSTFGVTNGVPGPISTSTSTSTSNYEYHDELRSMFTFIGRVGGLVTPDLLLYALGGGVLGNFVLPDSQDIFGAKRSLWKLGYTVGAGGEYRINNNWFLRAEYRYIHFEYSRDASNSSTSTSTSATSTSTFSSSSTTTRSTDFDFHMGKIGAVYKFCPGCGY